MADSLKIIIEKLKKTEIISSQPHFVEVLTSINKFANNDSFRAYWLGYFLKSKLDSDNLPAEIQSSLIDHIKSNKLDTYFYLKAKPEDDSFWNFGFLVLLLLIGVILIIVGTIQVKNGDFWYGLGTKYLVPIFRDGGYRIILGVFLFVGGLIRLRHEIKKKYFLDSFTISTKNSN